MKLILLGAPGAGKGTQAEVISAHYDIPQISTGNILKEAVKNATEMGVKAKSFMDAGQLVPDEVVIGIIKERLAQSDCEKGFILDGFPRTVPQAQALDKMGITLDKVIDIEVADELIEERMTGRRVCESCSASYHIINKPSTKGDLCEKCGGKLIIRKDDKPETVKERLKVYHDQTEPLKGFYEAKGLLAIIAGEGSVEQTSNATLKALEA
ncbi:MAG: adenylate kinase [Oscillospiraceae bacterium]